MFLSLRGVLIKNILSLLYILFFTLSAVMIADAKHFHIERPRLGLEFSYEFEEETRSGPVTNRKDVTHTFSEILDIETTGWVYHPALVVYSLALSPEWEQIREETTQAQSSSLNESTTFIQGYDAQITFLQHKPYTLSLIGHRGMSTIRNSFAGRTKQEEDMYASTLSLKNNVLPTYIRYSHRIDKSSGFFQSHTKENEVSLTTSNSSKIGSTRFTTSYIDSTKTVDDLVNDTRKEAFNLNNTFSFLNDNRAAFHTNMHYDRLIDKFSEEELYNLDESLELRHKKNFRTHYLFRYEDRTLERYLLNNKLRRQTIIGDFNLYHLLYENLSTTFSAGVNQNQSPNEEVITNRSSINFGYQRNIPWGNIRLSMGQGYRLVDISKSSGISNISDEPKIITTADIFLNNTDIDTSSIKVTDPTGLITYNETTDYVLSSVGSRTSIRCVSGAQFTVLECFNGASILIDYQYQSDLPFDYSTHTQSYGASLFLWEALNIYYRYDRSQQKFKSGIMPDKLTKDLSHKAGTELEYKWSSTVLRFEKDQGNTLPFDEVIIEETITLRPRSRMFMNFIMSYGKTTFTELSETEKFINMKAIIQQIISNRLKLSAEAFNRRSYGLRQDTAYSGLLLTLDWIYRVYDGNITYSYTEDTDRALQDSIKNNYIMFTIRRRTF